MKYIRFCQAIVQKKFHLCRKKIHQINCTLLEYFGWNILNSTTLLRRTFLIKYFRLCQAIVQKNSIKHIEFYQNIWNGIYSTLLEYCQKLLLFNKIYYIDSARLFCRKFLIKCSTSRLAIAESRKSDGCTAVSRRKVLLLNVIFEGLRKV